MKAPLQLLVIEKSFMVTKSKLKSHTVSVSVTWLSQNVALACDSEEVFSEVLFIAKSGMEGLHE